VYFFWKFLLFFSLVRFSIWGTLLNFGAKFCHLHCSSIVAAQPLFSAGLGARFQNALVLASFGRVLRGAGSERDSLWPVSSNSIHGTPLTPVPCTVNRPRPVSKHSGLDFFWASFLLGFWEKASLWHVSPNSTQGAWFTCFLTAFPWPPAQKGGPGQGLLWHVSSNSAQETFLTCFLTAVSRLPAKGRPRFQNTLVTLV